MSWWHYLLLVNIYLFLFYGFYVLLLRNETFFQLNRIYLVAASVLSFFIPVIQSEWVKDLFITKEVQLTIYNSPLVVYRFTPIQHTQLTFGDILAAAYLAGMLFLIGRFIWQMIALNKIIREPVSEIAFSFFKKIKLGEKHADNHVIAAHEHVHANQWHSADVLLIEAVMIVNWFNPVVYLYRYTIKHIHEYIADSQAVKTGTNKSEYALLLVSQTFNTPAHKLVNPFYNHSLLKQRIIMLQKNRSNHIALVKYGLSAPLFILMLVLSSATVYNSKTVGFVNKKVDQVLLAPAATQPNLVLNTTTAVQNTPASAIESQPVNIENAPPAKNTAAPDESLPIFTSVEQVPQFVGGVDGFYNYLSQNIRYPVDAREAGIQGKVIVSFIVEKDGSLSDARIARSVSPEIDDEALRVINASPKWKPGMQNGRQVRVAYSVPISFTLVNDYKPAVAPMFLPTGQSAPALRVNTVALRPDTTVKSVPFNLKGLPTDPLYLYNGKEIADMSGLNLNNIESISVLRDKAATALYGAKGAGGVVIITSRSKLLLKSQLPLLLPKDVEKH